MHKSFTRSPDKIFAWFTWKATIRCFGTRPVGHENLNRFCRLGMSVESGGCAMIVSEIGQGSTSNRAKINSINFSFVNNAKRLRKANLNDTRFRCTHNSV